MITSPDWLVLIIYAATVITIGYIAGKREKTVDDYFLGGRKMPWLSVMISIYATSASALTFIGVPGAAYGGDFHYLQLGLGDLVGRILVARFLLTAYYKGNVTTVYEFLGQRFGPRSRDAGTGFFIGTRLLASGVRLAGCAIALSVVFNMPLNTAIILIAAVAVAYTVFGGIKAVIWTDALQFGLLIGGAAVALIVIWHALPGGFSKFLSVGSEFNKFTIFHISMNPSHKDFFLNLNNPSSFVAGFLFGCFNTFAILGTDQDMVQRMLTCKNVKQSRKALIWTAVMNFPITLLFLSVGSALFAYYHTIPDTVVNTYTAMKHNDYIFPYFIKTVLGPGLRGLLIAGLLAAAMSSLDSALNALSSTVYVDIYKNYIRPRSDGSNAVKISRMFVIAFAVIIAVLAIMFGNTKSILWFGFKIAGYTYGALLGIFLLAVFTKKRGHDIINAVAMVTSVIVVIFLTADSVGPVQVLRTAILHPLGITKVAWPWAIVIGTLWTFCVAALFGNRKPENQP